MPEVRTGCAGIIDSIPSATCPAGATALDDPTATPPPPDEPGPDPESGLPGPADAGATGPSTPPAAADRSGTRRPPTGPTGPGAHPARGVRPAARVCPADPTAPVARAAQGRSRSGCGPSSWRPAMPRFAWSSPTSTSPRPRQPQIGGEVAKVTALGVAAIVLVLIAAMLLVLGTSLFLGEWLLGSMGWGIVNGLEACLAVAMSCIFLALGIAPQRIVRALVIGIVVGVIVGLILLTQRAEPSLRGRPRGTRRGGRPGQRARSSRARCSSGSSA